MSKISEWRTSTKDIRTLFAYAFASLLVLLQQLNEFAGGLGALPKPELSEVVSSVVRLCGFVNPIEARDVIGTVLDALEIEDPIPEPRFVRLLFRSTGQN
jgi:hypothetical protein